MNARPRPTRSSTHHPHLRRLTGAIAIIVAGGCGGPQSTPTPGATSLDVSARTGAPIVADSVRGVDPSTVGAPLYLISMSVETDNTANISSLVYYKNGGPNNPNLSTFAPADQLRVGIEAVIGRNGGLVEGPDPVTCQVGDWRDGGDLGPGLWTSPGGLYTACMKNPDRPDVVGKPIAFNAPTQVGMTDQLYLYARLEVLDGGEVWGPGSDPTAGVSGALNGLGGAFNVLGAFTAFTPVGAIAKGVGTFMQMVGQYTAPSAHGPVPACLISDTLVPGFGPNDPPSDTGSPLVRVPLDGRQLYELTARGDAAVAYDLDWRPFPQTTMCQKNRPHTKILWRIRRVGMAADPGAPVISEGGTTSGSYPDALDAVAVDCNGRVVHDQRGADPARPLAWETGDAVPYVALPSHAHIATISRAPGLVDLFAVSTSGDIVTTWRSRWADNNQWHNWFPITSGGKFPAGAPVSVVTRNPDHIDVFAIANDGSIMTAWFDVCCGWNREFAVSPASEVPAWNGSTGGGLAAVSRSNDFVDVYVADHDWRLANAYWTSSGGWGFARDDGPLWVRPGSNIAAVSRNSNHTDVFYIDGYGKLLALAWQGGWGAPVQILPDTMPLQVGAPVAAVVRKVNASGDPTIDNDHLDVFTIGQNGHVLHEPWRYGDDNYTWNPTRAEQLAATATVGGDIGASALYAGTIEVAARRANSSLVYTWIENVEENVNNWQLGAIGDGDGTSACGNSCCGSGAECVAGACCSVGKACGNVCCGGNDTCGGGGASGVCGCTPLKCGGNMCGSMPDGCGGTLSCGGCSTYETCYANQCTPKRCVPRVCGKGYYWDPDTCSCHKGLPM